MKCTEPDNRPEFSRPTQSPKLIGVHSPRDVGYRVAERACNRHRCCVSGFARLVDAEVPLFIFKNPARPESGNFP